MIMLLSFLRITIRNFWRYKLFSIINITGLTIGLACSILIFLYVRDELSYDKFHDNYENIYRIKVKALIQGNESEFTHTGAAVGGIFVDGIPEVVKATRMLHATANGTVTVKVNDNMYVENNVFYADRNFFDIFTFDMLSGDPKSALIDPGSVVITEAQAKKYFSNKDPLNQTIRINSKEYKVTGVTQNCPSNSHFHYDLLISYSSHWVSKQTTWINNDFTYTYLVLKDNTPETVFIEKSTPIIHEHLAPEIEKAFGVTLEKMLSSGNKYMMHLQPISDIHLKSHTESEIEVNSSEIYVYFFSVIAIFILVLAGINFTNLSTARSTIRAKEVGIRKVIGSSRKKLIVQFLFESVIYSLFSLILAMIIVEFILPYLNNLTFKNIHIEYAKNPEIVIALFLLALILGICSGLYSALYLSSIKILKVIQGQLLSFGKSNVLRNGLVIFQFTIATILFISTLIIRSQLNYIQTKDLGYNKENIIVIERTWKLRENQQAFKNELSAYSDISSISFTETVPGRGFNGYFLPVSEDKGGMLNPRVIGVEPDFINTYQVKMAHGRFFSDQYSGDTLGAVINESLQKELGYKEPIGKQFRQNNQLYTIIGVVKNFSFSTLHKNVGSLLMLNAKWRYTAYCSVRINDKNLPKIVNYMQDTWAKFVPDSPMEYYFLDDDFVNLHKEEFVTGKLFAYFSILAIFIACLGLFGLSTFVAEKKRKEIGIRKVNGATTSNIISLLIRNFSLLIVLANMIAWPIGYFLMQKWLQKFAYHVDIKIGSFIMATLLALTIAWITVMYQAIKTARQNPVDSLRYE